MGGGRCGTETHHAARVPGEQLAAVPTAEGGVGAQPATARAHTGRLMNNSQSLSGPTTAADAPDAVRGRGEACGRLAEITAGGGSRMCLHRASVSPIRGCTGRRSRSGGVWCGCPPCRRHKPQSTGGHRAGAPACAACQESRGQGHIWISVPVSVSARRAWHRFGTGEPASGAGPGARLARRGRARCCGPPAWRGGLTTGCATTRTGGQQARRERRRAHARHPSRWRAQQVIKRACQASAHSSSWTGSWTARLDRSTLDISRSSCSCSAPSGSRRLGAGPQPIRVLTVGAAPTSSRSGQETPASPSGSGSRTCVAPVRHVEAPLAHSAVYRPVRLSTPHRPVRRNLGLTIQPVGFTTHITPRYARRPDTPAQVRSSREPWSTRAAARIVEARAGAPAGIGMVLA